MDFLTKYGYAPNQEAMSRALDLIAANLDKVASEQVYKDLHGDEKLEQALRSNAPCRNAREVLNEAQVLVTRPEESTRMDDNGVNTTEQMVELVRNAYQLQYVMQSISTDLATLRTAVRG